MIPYRKINIKSVSPLRLRLFARSGAGKSFSQGIYIDELPALRGRIVEPTLFRPVEHHPLANATIVCLYCLIRVRVGR